MSQAPGRSGTPWAGHCSSAATRASCASSSAVPMSPTTRVSPAASLEHHPRFDQLFIELLILRHGVRRWGSCRLALVAFLCQYQHTHLCLLLLQLPLPSGLGLLRPHPLIE